MIELPIAYSLCGLPFAAAFTLATIRYSLLEKIAMEEQLKTADEAVAARPQEAKRYWRFTPYAILFFSSACVMVMELVAGRLIARHLGTSLYTWTSIIGVVLAGISIGNFAGGKLADRWRPEKMLGWLLHGVVGGVPVVAAAQ